MAHFAKIEDGIVREVIVVNNETIQKKSFPESEPIGISFCKSLYGENTEWVQTSYNESFRNKFASLGDKYDSEKDEFISPITTSEI